MNRRTPESMDEADWDEIDLPDGDTAMIPQDDQVHPTFGNYRADTTVQIQQGAISVSGHGECVATVSGPVRTIDAPEYRGSIFAAPSFGTDVDDVFAEITFMDVDQVRRLRDALDLMLRYWGETDG